ncbi:ADP-ribosylglycohydrolase family protein [Rheinheimera riviphila]|uniref:ADP-ribosylglycohydrolase family protein n=1 Tax=Rheinheimera riviphila TaxID=1834037 RepID=A0A437QR60_9GAMM|nr:ADP-ribosylglycohydrolase family protein [Rheinheimera riviphila]RVU37003.1 ADP-ribosylglycohydrolase family protein [Rheinheimera riviphila]
MEIVNTAPDQAAIAAKVARAQAAMLSFLAADALGVQVEFLPLAELSHRDPQTLLTMQDNGPWHSLAGQPTEDGELVILQTRMLLFYGCYREDTAWQAYQYWLQTDPFAIAPALQRALTHHPSEHDCSLAALSRLLPISVLGVHFSLPQIAAWAMEDTALTQPALLCQQASGLYAMLLAKAIDEGTSADDLYQDLQQWARDLKVDSVLKQLIDQALFMPPANYQDPAQPVLCAFHNAIWQMLYAKSVGDAISESIKQGGDTGSYAAIAAAVVGAIHGLSSVRQDWVDVMQHCKPQEGVTGVDQPRPEAVWPTDAAELAKKLVEMTPAELV